MTDEELAEMERLAKDALQGEYRPYRPGLDPGSVIALIAALREARTVYAKDMATMQMRVDHARLNQRTDDERELWEAGKAERDQLRAETERMRRICDAAIACDVYDVHACGRSDRFGEPLHCNPCELRDALDAYRAGGAK